MMTDRIPAIDLTRHHKKRDIGDLTLFCTWYRHEDTGQSEPALVIVPRYRSTGFKPCVVALSAAHKYNSPDGGRYLAWAGRIFAQQLGFEDSMTNARKIATLIHDHLLDLIMTPPDPKAAIVVGEANVDLGDGKKTKIELLEHVQQRQA